MRLKIDIPAQSGYHRDMKKEYYELEQRVMAYCRTYQLFTPGDGVVLGVSGGADSVCLLFALHELRQELGIHLYVVHVNHGIRPDAAKDATYVEELCRKLEIPFTLVEKDVNALAKEQGCSTEEAGRQVRYNAFDRELQCRQAQKIVVAHHAGDRAETMLFHLFRGTGLTGLGSIRPRRGQIVRPLLDVERRDIEAYLQQRQIRYCQDSTNETDEYTRNRIRHHILSYAEQEICSGATVHLCHTADIFAEIEDYMERQIRLARELCVVQASCSAEDIPGRIGIAAQQQSGMPEICCADFCQQHPAIQKGLILELLKEISPQHKDMGMCQVEQVLELCTQPGNREICLPQGIRAGRSYDRVYFKHQQKQFIISAEQDRRKETLEQDRCKETAEQESQDGLDHSPTIYRQISVPQHPGESISCKVEGGSLVLRYLTEETTVALLDSAGVFPGCKDKKSVNLPENQYTKWLDYDKIDKLLEWRTRRTGDYLEIRTPAGLGHKTIKSLFIDEKLPHQERDCIPMLAQGNHILWVAGGRISESCKITSDTIRILQIQYIPENKVR